MPSARSLSDSAAPPFAINLFVALRQKPQCDLRRIAEQRLAHKIATLIFNSDNRSTFRLNCNHVAAIDPQVSLPHAIRALFINSRRVHRPYCATKPSKTMNAEAYLTFHSKTFIDIGP